MGEHGEQTKAPGICPVTGRDAYRVAQDGAKEALVASRMASGTDGGALEDGCVASSTDGGSLEGGPVASSKGSLDPWQVADGTPHVARLEADIGDDDGTPQMAWLAAADGKGDTTHLVVAGGNKNSQVAWLVADDSKGDRTPLVVGVGDGQPWKWVTSE